MANQMLYATLQLELREARAELAAAIAERAHYGNMMSAKLGQCENERDALREDNIRAAGILGAVMRERDALRDKLLEWRPFTEAAQDCQGSLLVWREDAGTFAAFYDDDARCWFTESGEDLTGDLPTFYAKMPQGPTSE